MTQVEEIQVRIRSLPIEDFSKLRDWFLELEDEIWDKKIQDLNFLKVRPVNCETLYLIRFLGNVLETSC